jgi:hypothetical protein
MRRTSSKQLTGPKSTSNWQAWRAARDRAIANPPRLRTCKSKSSPRAQEWKL